MVFSLSIYCRSFFAAKCFRVPSLHFLLSPTLLYSLVLASASSELSCRAFFVAILSLSFLNHLLFFSVSISPFLVGVMSLPSSSSLVLLCLVLVIFYMKPILHLQTIFSIYLLPFHCHRFLTSILVLIYSSPFFVTPLFVVMTFLAGF